MELANSHNERGKKKRANYLIQLPECVAKLRAVCGFRNKDIRVGRCGFKIQLIIVCPGTVSLKQWVKLGERGKSHSQWSLPRRHFVNSERVNQVRRDWRLEKVAIMQGITYILTTLEWRANFKPLFLSELTRIDENQGKLNSFIFFIITKFVFRNWKYNTVQCTTVKIQSDLYLMKQQNPTKIFVK